MEYLLGKASKYDITNHYGLTIVPADTLINDDYLELMRKHRIDLDSIILDLENYNGDIHPKILQQTVNRSKDLFDTIKISRKIPLIEIRKEILPIVQQTSENANVFKLFEAVRAKDDYTYEHNIGVGVLSTLIGRWIDLSELELSTLTLAATLHDVGKVKIPIEVLNKPGKLTKEEYQLVKQHTIFGYELLKETTGLSSRVALVALQHHEREDGQGYPFGLKKDKIDLFSSIVAVADIFHAMSSKRPYHEPIPFYEIINQMRIGKFGELNPYIVSVFIDNIMKHLIGEKVVLTDGSFGEVVYLNPHCLEKPLVKVDDHFWDLSRERDIQIKEVVIV
ncbi:HD-GYP domain-containing protein [Cohnella sp. WQ 127256]|uniref:HD-GYP domain-containing protein n=1 Tax=Cohnella sp. WQ 127256 TaxID=2938790 RepID=UPI002118646E|nr:HD-GYP domain-containing protein [Cohnella sp. WQ 127256]